MKKLLLAAALIVPPLFTGAALAETKARILTFGDSNTWGWKPVAAGYPAQRYNDDQRWSGILDAALPQAAVVVDGMVGRRTDIDAGGDVGPVEKSDFNGAEALPEVIARNMPLDLVVIMLGTNDLQNGSQRPPSDVAKAAFGLADLVKRSDMPVFTSYPAPEVLIIAPPALGDTGNTKLSGLFQAGEEPSTQLGAAFAAEAERTGIPFFDASKVTGTDGVDGVHMNADNHKALGEALAPVVADMLKD